jgi:adenylate cyclase
MGVNNPRDILILQPDPAAAKALSDYFAGRGDRVHCADDGPTALTLAQRHAPQLALVDLHLTGESYRSVLEGVRAAAPKAQIIATNRYPVLQREQEARELGVTVFLRQPFTEEWISAALQRLAQAPTAPALPLANLPPVRVPMRLKITAPYALLAVIIAVAAAWLASQAMFETIEQRFTNQLIEAGKLSRDWLVAQENHQLETLRLVANLQGLPEALAAGDAERLRELVLPVVVNAGEETVSVLDASGVSVLTLRRPADSAPEAYAFTRSSAEFVQWLPAQRVLAREVDVQGDKYSGLYAGFFYVVGPVLDEAGQLRGAVLVGRRFETLAREMRRDTLAHTTFYSRDGQVLASTFSAFGTRPPLMADLAAQAMRAPEANSVVAPVTIGSLSYSEILGSWQARNGESLGLLGAALAQSFLIQASQVTRLQIFLLVTGAFILIIVIGLFLAARITRPLLRLVRAAGEVAHGNFDYHVDARGNDEVAVLSESFNQMTDALREGSLYRDLLGRTVSPQVRETLRQTFSAGRLRLEGQEALATVLMCDIRNFTGLSEQASPSTIMAWLNEYFGELVPIVNAYGGVVNKFDGDAMLVFFGILPRAMPVEESAYLGCRAAADILAAVERVNARRAAQNEPPLITGLGVNTGPVAAGGLGAADRLHYTIIGDTVNVAQRLETLTRQFGQSGAIVSHYTYLALGARRAEFHFDEQGTFRFRGKQTPLRVYRLRPAAEPAASPTP